MTPSTTCGPDGSATGTTSATAAPTAIDSVDRERPSSRRKAVFVTSLVALAAAVAVVGIVFPGMLGAAMVIAVLAVLVVMDSLFRPRELQRDPETFWSL